MALRMRSSAYFAGHKKPPYAHPFRIFPPGPSPPNSCFHRGLLGPKIAPSPKECGRWPKRCSKGQYPIDRPAGSFAGGILSPL